MVTSDPTASKVPDRKEEEFMSIGSLTGAGNMVKIYVGPEKKCWMIHEAVICNKSTFFRNAFRGNFAEGTSKTMTLEEDDPAVFSLFVDWLCGSNDGKWDKDLKNSCERRLAWYGLDIFADKIGSKKLRKYVEDLYDDCSWFGDDECGRHSAIEVEIVFETSPTDSPFRSDMILTALDQFLGNDFNDFKWWGEDHVL
ncbi:hypothetical protein ONS95_010614 [Cadophora gregata]|uniref:uncharacterized protein n=1 Tax=Cadophora gregata TaxID=51156 RepID=UPI0026DDC53C|nr:uncharacterized protein ONS95_010614 [Cadophora gregata]KAK0122373.1 hypothetical protein ONS95_010614 [Cadophora gregata]KAK0127852.1 hypothetical protein ONS96_007353 [Cadophora gregata f. sp. sojae]